MVGASFPIAENGLQRACIFPIAYYNRLSLFCQFEKEKKTKFSLANRA